MGVEKTTAATDDPSTLSIPSMVEVDKSAVVEETTASRDQTEHIEVGVSTKKRFNFLVVGTNGSGKSSFATSALTRYFPSIELNPINGPTSVIEERGRCEKNQGSTQIIVTIVDTPGFGDTINNNDRIVPIIDYIQHQNQEYEKGEGYRTPNHQQKDSRIHCCFYFMMPHRVTPLDIEFMSKLQHKVPLVPIVAKSDTMNIKELELQLYNIHQALKENSIKVFDFKEKDIDGSWVDTYVTDTEADEVTVNRRQIPNVFAVITGVRDYSWGIADETNPLHSDTPRLHNVLFRNKELQSLGRLQDHANQIHEEWRIAAKKASEKEEEDKRVANEEKLQREKLAKYEGERSEREARKSLFLRRFQALTLVIAFSVQCWVRYCIAMDHIPNSWMDKNLVVFLGFFAQGVPYFFELAILSLVLKYLLLNKKCA